MKIIHFFFILIRISNGTFPFNKTAFIIIPSTNFIFTELSTITIFNTGTTIIYLFALSDGDIGTGSRYCSGNKTG